MSRDREVVVKFQFGNDVRRLTFLYLEDGFDHDGHESRGGLIPLSYLRMIEIVERLYGYDSLPRDFQLRYTDDEGDHIGLTRDEEVRAAIAALPPGKPLRIAIVDPNAPPASTGTAQKNLSGIHNVLCRRCGCQIEGVRFVCVNCPEDYSLCAQCESLREHDDQHVFLKVYTPLPAEALHFLPLPNLYAPSGSSTQTVVSTPNWIRQRNTSSSTDLSNKLAARFVEDLTIEDGYEAKPNDAFVKIWRMRNIGNTAWPEGVTMAWVSGDQLSAAGDSVPVMALPAGAEVDISVPMLAPNEPGRYVSNWRLRSPSGAFFGHRVWVDIMVKNTAQREQTSSETEAITDVQTYTNGDAEIESAWEQPSSKVRKISKIRRSHSDVESDDDDDLACHESLPESLEASIEPRDEWEVLKQEPAVTTAQEITEEPTAEQQEEQPEAVHTEQPQAVPAQEEEEAIADDTEALPEPAVKTQNNTATAEDGWEMVKTEKEEKWAQELALLQEMGIGNVESIRKALIQTNGDLQLAAQSLLGE